MAETSRPDDFIQRIKTLRISTGLGLPECKTALEINGWDVAKSANFLSESMEKRSAKIQASTRELKEGKIETFQVSPTLAVIIEINCVTDFVAKTTAFQRLALMVAMQIGRMRPQNVFELMASTVPETSLTLQEYIDAVALTLGEPVQVSRFVIYEVGGD